MDSKIGGQSSNDLQRQAAATIARRKVLAAYAKSAKNAEKEQNASSYKNEPVTHKINSESWKKYHSAWQDYYQKYYSEYYSNAARNYNTSIIHTLNLTEVSLLIPAKYEMLICSA